MDNTVKELERMYDNFIEELSDYEKLTRVDFIIKYCSTDTEEEIDKQYKQYKDYVESYDDDLEDMYDKWEWTNEIYAEENSDSLQDIIYEYFTDYWRDEYVHTEYKDQKIIDLNLAWWWPHIDLHIETKYESIEWQWSWWWHTFKEECTEYYDTICTLYNINDY